MYEVSRRGSASIRISYVVDAAMKERLVSTRSDARSILQTESSSPGSRIQSRDRDCSRQLNGIQTRHNRR